MSNFKAIGLHCALRQCNYLTASEQLKYLMCSIFDYASSHVYDFASRRKMSRTSLLQDDFIFYFFTANLQNKTYSVYSEEMCVSCVCGRVRSYALKEKD